ncbi:hypothetical protein RB195_007907 [Necator americanus]
MPAIKGEEKLHDREVTGVPGTVRRSGAQAPTFETLPIRPGICACRARNNSGVAEQATCVWGLPQGSKSPAADARGAAARGASQVAEHSVRAGMKPE